MSAHYNSARCCCYLMEFSAQRDRIPFSTKRSHALAPQFFLFELGPVLTQMSVNSTIFQWAVNIKTYEWCAKKYIPHRIGFARGVLYSIMFLHSRLLYVFQPPIYLIWFDSFFSRSKAAQYIQIQTRILMCPL